MKKYLFLLLLIIVSSCSKKLLGTYSHTSCCMRYGCEKIILKKHNKYNIIRWNHMTPIDTIEGIYKRCFNTITLEPILPHEYKQQEPHIVYGNSIKNDSTILHLYELSAMLTKINYNLYNLESYYGQIKQKLNKKDTISSYSFFKINNVRYSTDSVGYAKVKLKIQDTISILDFFSQKIIFKHIVNKVCDTLNVYYPAQGYNPYFYEKTVVLKNNHLYEKSKEFSPELYVKNTKNYKCINNIERRSIKDTVYKLINKNIDKGVFSNKDYMNDFYLVFDKEGVVKRIINNPSYSNNLHERLASLKIKKELIRILENYKIPYFDKINYNYLLHLSVDYDEGSKQFSIGDY